MLEAIRSAGHDPLIIGLPGIESNDTAEIATKFAIPYLESGLPVIIGVDNKDAGGGHAVVSIGFSNGALGEMYPKYLTIHNDNTGCYLQLPQLPLNAGDYALSQTIALITPLPDGISMTAAEAEQLATTMLSLGRALLENHPSISEKKSTAEGLGAAPELCLRVFLSSRHSFRRWATKSLDIDEPTQVKYRSFELPKFLWIAEIHELSSFTCGQYIAPSRLGEVVFDASADALHGDSLIFMRLSGLIMGSNAPDDGLLLTEGVANGSTRELISVKAPRALPQIAPWK